ncbi:hypothetical protein LTR08_007890 [Meristemomyces frigidus]|nr:hypothetical protein LTR08_007890 [Meristemomyces frigidus]
MPVRDTLRMRPTFFQTSSKTAEEGSLAILHLKRDSSVPVMLRTEADDGYAEGGVTNTRFGSFPHSTLIGVEWGSQVRASKVDTGTRGRKSNKEKVGGGGEEKRAADEQVVQSGGAAIEVGGDTVEEASKKRKSDEAELYDGGDVSKKAKPSTVVLPEQPPPESTSTRKPVSQKRKSNYRDADTPAPVATKPRQKSPELPNGGQIQKALKVPIEAGSGFIHVLQPTPESWTASLDHRTQVVYTPDYSYILQRLRAHPGGTIIEAGAGSGSFTHAAARAVFSGYPTDPTIGLPTTKKRKLGQVYSYEYHAPRFETLGQEISEHGLDGVVQLTHRDVCNDGFMLPNPSEGPPPSPNASAIFLDLPAPWLAFPHLTRASPNSALNPETAVHLCTFSPCIEQVIATVSAMRKAGWTEIEMIEIQNRRVDVRREQVGLQNEGLRGVNASAATVDEAVGRLREVERKMGDFNAFKHSAVEGAPLETKANGDGVGNDPDTVSKLRKERKIQSKQERFDKNKEAAAARKVWKEGNLVHRTEMEVKTHTSYLVFAVLPREWTEEDEDDAAEKWPVGDMMRGEKAETKGEVNGKSGAEVVETT